MQIQIRANAKGRWCFACENCARFTRAPFTPTETRDLRTAAENQPRSADRCPHRNAGILGFRGPTPLSAVRPIVIVANYTVSVNCYTDVTPCKQPSSKLGRVEGSRGC